jgi:hypothetical protein
VSIRRGSRAAQNPAAGRRYILLPFLADRQETTMATRLLHGLAATLLVMALAAPAGASYHDMQIEQVIGGVCGDTTKQAIQLRMRALGQNLVSGKKLVAYDANGQNPITLLTFPGNVTPNVAAGSRILITTAALAADLGGVPAPDFQMTQRIPDGYLRAGRVTFEDPSLFGILWSVSWGGTNYVGANTGSSENDLDGNFGPAEPGWAPFVTARSLLYGGPAANQSTNNAADYALGPNPATVTNNAGTGSALKECVFGDGYALGHARAWDLGTGFELCNGNDDDGDAQSDEDFPINQPCTIPGDGAGTYQCTADGRDVTCVP